MDIDRTTLRHLVLALLDFQRRPGRYPVLRSEPRIVFDHLTIVLLLAADRKVAAMTAMKPGPRREARARNAARYFVRTVLLRPAADPETLLGLPAAFDSAQLREHYRLMMRMTHPDLNAKKSGLAHAWPLDAAQRVNLANQTLIEQLASARSASRELPPCASEQQVPLHARPTDVPELAFSLSRHAHPQLHQWLKPWLTRFSVRQTATLATAAAIGLAALAIWLPSVDPEPLQAKRLSLLPLGTLKVSTAWPGEVLAMTPTEPELPRDVSLNDVQLAIANLVSSLHSGDGLRVVARVELSRQLDADNQAFARSFDQLTEGRRVKDIRAVSMATATGNGSLEISTIFEIDLSDPHLDTVRRRMRLNALFNRYGDDVALTQLSLIRH